MDFAPGIFEKKYLKKNILGDGLKMLMSDHPIQFLLKRLSLRRCYQCRRLEILVGRSIWGNKKLELSVSMKLLIEFESSYFNKII